MNQLIKRYNLSRSRRSPRDSAAHTIERAIKDWVYVYTSESYLLFMVWFHGQQEARWMDLCQSCREVPGVELSPLEERMLDAWTELAESCGWVYPCGECCLLCERPERIELNQHELLHSDDGPAVCFRDGCAVWALNGVAVPEWLVTTPAEELEPRHALQIYNAEIRREFVRKVGIERICSTLGAVCLDRRDDYELLMLNMAPGWRRPYLRMKNPSTGTWHIEGVDSRCRTVKEALAWRNGTDLTPIITT